MQQTGFSAFCQRVDIHHTQYHAAVRQKFSRRCITANARAAHMYACVKYKETRVLVSVYSFDPAYAATMAALVVWREERPKPDVSILTPSTLLGSISDSLYRLFHVFYIHLTIEQRKSSKSS